MGEPDLASWTSPCSGERGLHWLGRSIQTLCAFSGNYSCAAGEELILAGGSLMHAKKAVRVVLPFWPGWIPAGRGRIDFKMSQFRRPDCDDDDGPNLVGTRNDNRSLPSAELSV